MCKHLLENDILYCDHLGASEGDETDISSFSVKHSTGVGLVRYLQFNAFPDEYAGMMRTYIVRDQNTHSVVGYFSLKAGLVSTNEQTVDEKVSFDTIPGVELANFAVNYAFIRHSHITDIGLAIFHSFVLPIAQRASELIGASLIYLFALPYPKLIAAYQNYGFSRLPGQQERELHNRLKPSYDEMCIFMFQMLPRK